MHHISRTDVSFDKFEAAVSSYPFQISQIGTVVKLVHNNDLEGMGRNNQSSVSETFFLEEWTRTCTKKPGDKGLQTSRALRKKWNRKQACYLVLRIFLSERTSDVWSDKTRSTRDEYVFWDIWTRNGLYRWRWHRKLQEFDDRDTIMNRFFMQLTTIISKQNRQKCQGLITIWERNTTKTKCLKTF